MKKYIHFFLPAIFIMLSICSAAIPYGGVAIWSQTITGLLALTALILSLKGVSPHIASLPFIAIISLALLGCWIALHTTLVHFNFIEIPDVGNNTILLSNIYIWLAFGAIAWSSTKLCSNRQLLKFISTSIVIIGTAEAALGIASLYTDLGVFRVFVDAKRAVGTFSSGNSFGGFIALSLLITLGSTLARLSAAIEHIIKRGKSILHVSTREDYILLTLLALLFATLLQLTALVASGSRGALISVLCTAPILLLWYGIENRNKNSNRYTIPLAIAFIGIIMLIGAGGTYAIALNRFQELSDTHTAALPRLVIWQAALAIISSFPLGIGLGAFPNIFPAFQPDGFNMNRVYHAHNDYLELLAELGLPGMILLLIAIASVLVVATKSLAAPSKGNSIWRRRSALLALIAALIHATVDFNLSSRPGVTILFFAILGIAISRPQSTARRAKQKRHARGSLASRLTRPNLIALAASLILILPLLIHQVRFSISTIIMRQGFAALGGSPSLYFILPTHPLPPDQAIKKLQLATKITPKYSHAHVLLGRSRLLAHALKRSDLVDKTIANGSDIARSVLNHQISIALRQEELHSLNAADKCLQTALKLAPDSLDANNYYLKIIGKKAYLADNSESFHSLVNQLLILSKKSAKMAPNDLTTNRIIFIALTKACRSNQIESFSTLKSELIVRIQNQASHLLHLNAETVTDVLTNLARLKIEPATVLDNQNIHLPVIWKIYQHYNSQENVSEALSALQHLSIAVESTNPTSVIFNSSQLKSQRKRYKALMTAERCKWHLRTHDFSSYINLASARTAVLNTYLSSQLSKSEKKTDLDSQVRYLTFNRLYAQRGIDSAHREEYHQLTKQHGAGNRLLNTIISPIALFPPYTNSPSMQIENSESMAYKHRLSLLQAKHLIQTGKHDQAKQLLLSLLKKNHRDPDIATLIIQHAQNLKIEHEVTLTAIQYLKDISPEHYVGMQFSGRQAELTGITVDPDLLQTFWRFRAPIKHDLQVLVLFRNDQNKTVYSSVLNLKKQFPIEFGNGNPKLGTIFKLSFKLPKTISKSSRMIIGLRHKGKFMRSEENLPYCELYNWMDLAYYKHIFRNQTTPEPNACKAFGIDEYLPKKRFSHNIHRILNAPAYYPLLDNQRTTTTPSTWQPCLSATGIVEHAAEAANIAFDNNPHMTMFPLGINDGQDWCQCEACKKLCPPNQQKTEASQRWWSEPYWNFVNQVAKKINSPSPVHPFSRTDESCAGKKVVAKTKNRIGAIAYSSVVKVPTFNLQSNVTVYLCQDAGSHFDLKEKTRDANRLKNWLKVCSDVGIYNYAGLVSWVFPRYCRDEIAADIHLASNLGVDKFYIENTWITGLNGPLPWIAKKLIQNPELDPKKLQKQYCTQTFGPAAETMDLYFDYLQEVWQSPPHGKWFDGLFKIDEQVKRYPPSVRKKMQTYISNARRLAFANSAALNRINIIASPLQLSEAFATENDIMQKIQIPITTMESLIDTEENLEKLKTATKNRNQLLKRLTDYSWGKDAKHALASSQIESTINRWNKKQNQLIKEKSNTTRILRNAITITPAEQNKK